MKGDRGPEGALAVPLPGFGRMTLIILGEVADASLRFFSAMPLILLDCLWQRLAPWSRRIPAQVADLLDPAVYSQVVRSALPVVAVRQPAQAEQHANSTDRAALEVECAGSETLLLLSYAGVYRNEINRYSAVELPGVSTPHAHCARASPSRFVLVVEDLSRRGEVRMPSLWMQPECSRELAQRVLATLARVHARYLDRPPAGIWDDRGRPAFPGFMGLLTLCNCMRVEELRRAVPPDIHEAFVAALWHWSQLRRHWSAGRQTLVHGDAHIGNMYLIDRHGDELPEVGLFDFQCVASEHPMRDVTYFLCSSYPAARAEEDVPGLLRHYLARLGKELQALGRGELAPSFEECWGAHRTQCFYAMYAFVFSGGIGGELQDVRQTRILLERCSAVMRHCGAAGGLQELLSPSGSSAASTRN